MSALVRLVPMPDELDRGYMVRLMRANGYCAEHGFFRGVERSFGFEKKSRHELPKIELLATIAGLSVEKFVMRHSTLPLRRSIIGSFSEVAHGSTDNCQILSRRTLMAIRPEAYFCVACANADIEFHGLSYWRRSLQVPGMLWCEKHELPLRYFEYEKAMLQSPDQLCEKSDVVDEEFAREAAANHCVKKFYAIASGLMDHPVPLRTGAVRLILQSRAVAMGLQSGAGKVRNPLISDLISSSFPKRWLRTVFPDVADKPSGEFLHRVDGIFTMTSAASSVWPYILAAAVLFDSSNQALNALFATNESMEGRSNPKKPQETKKRETLEVASAEWSLNRERSIRNLANSTPREIWRAAFLFYVEEQTFSKSAHSAGANLEQFETFLRKIYPTFIARLVAMASTDFEKVPCRKSAKPLSPKQANVDSSKINRSKIHS